MLGILSLFAFSFNWGIGVSNVAEGPRYFNTPLLEILQNDLYLTNTDFNEVIVTSAGKGVDLRPNDYITHADGVRVLSSGLADFIKSDEKEVIIPVIDDEDSKHGGHRVIGFVMLQTVTPRKLASRRGEILFDFEEGGPPPTLKLGNIVVGSSGAKTTSDPAYQPPPHGGGACITGRDCYNFNGTCNAGFCSCKGTYTGTYCQLNRPDYAAISMMLKKQQQQTNPQSTKLAAATEGVRIQSKASPEPPPQQQQAAAEKQPIKLSVGEPKLPPASTQQQQQQQQSVEAEPKQETVEVESADEDKEDRAGAGGSGAGDGKKRRKRKPKPKPANAIESEAEAQQHPEAAPTTDRADVKAAPVTAEAAAAASGEKVWTRGAPEEQSLSQEEKEEQQRQLEQQRAMSQMPTMEDLYGADKAYPEPYVAGKLPNQLVHERFRKRYNRERFLYSVRYRQGPIGISFDNKVLDGCIVENVARGQQSDLSDVKAGDQLIAIDQFNVSTAPAKIAQRIMSTLGWPRTLVFQAKVAAEDAKTAESKAKQRTYNVSVVYPPTLVTEFQIRVAEWTPMLNLQDPLLPYVKDGIRGKDQFCPVYRIKAGSDVFGCKIAANEFSLNEAFETMVRSKGMVSREVEEHSQMFSMLMQETHNRNLVIEPRSLAIAKRGVCTFVDKARQLMSAGGKLGIVVNTDNEVLDMPSGKEKTGDCQMTLGLARDVDGNLLQVAASTNDIWAIVSDPSGMSPACERVQGVAEDIIDKWPHSVPAISTPTVLQSKPPESTKLRGLTEEGGRIAVSGQNGWAFFDYHLAMFGPQEVPLGPFKLQMALPPFGCDPGAYTVRIKDTVVAILRGGGCSFGIKVINAQKLGAKAVMIVNTDDMKTMRLMALPDEIPQIQIPCIMVSRRIQFYLEEQLRPYYPIDQHYVSIQPTGIFGEYEKRNMLTLPVRLTNS